MSTIVLATACTFCCAGTQIAYAKTETTRMDRVTAATDALPEGINLSPAERGTADAVIMPRPGEVVEAAVIPDGCADPDTCGYIARATGPAVQGGFVGALAAGALPRAIAVHRSRIGRIRVTRVKHDRHTSRSPSARAASAATTRTWGAIYDDHICNFITCLLWEVQLNSKAYCDGSWAWGAYSRFGYVGWVSKTGTKTNGGSVSTDFLGFRADPSHTDMYASHGATVSASYGSAQSSRTVYVHRHYTGDCRSWVVTG